MNKIDLIQFEEKMANKFNSGLIPHPIHFANGYEIEILNLFKEVESQDWIFCSWRSHYQCLLKGVNPNVLEQAISTGKSISLCFPDFNIYSSAIVGGHLPHAVGVAYQIKNKGLSGKVWCFLGDMASETGIAQTCFQYALTWDLPITFIVEDNEKSVLTDTKQVWNVSKLRYELLDNPKIRSYKYKSKYPHAGAGIRVQF